MFRGLRIGSWPRTFPRPTGRMVVAVACALTLLLLLGAGLRFSRRLSALRALQATGPNWSFPSRVYSGDVPLVVGREISDEYLRSELAARAYTEVRGRAETPGTYAHSRHGWSIVLRGSPDAADPQGHGGPERIHLQVDRGAISAVDRLGVVPGAPAPDLANPPRLEPMLISTLFDDGRVWRVHVP